MKPKCYTITFFLLALTMNACEEKGPDGPDPDNDKNTIDLSELHDLKKAIENPNKGWYHHFYANSDKAYGYIGQDLTVIPGLQYLYLRLAWSYFEQNEGEYDWSLIDKVVSHYKSKYKIALCITSKETSPTPDFHDGVYYATPFYVSQAGAKGNIVSNWGTKQWEPMYDDAIFLEKLDNFVQALASKYDGKEYIHSIDIGSIGEWGEGHTGYSSNITPTPSTVKKHIDIYTSHFQETPIVLNDDYIYWNKNSTQSNEIRSYAGQKGLWYSEWSAMVEWWVKEGAPGTYGIHHPELYENVYRDVPVTLEMHHYNDWVKWGIWCLPDGMYCGNYGFNLAASEILITHSTYIGFQGWPATFVEENPNAVKDLLNLAGYWYTADKMKLTRTNEKSLELSIDWNNRGAAPAYHDYTLMVKITEPDGTSYKFEPDECNVKAWLPQRITSETYEFVFEKELQPGEYTVSVKMVWDNQDVKETVDLALNYKYLDTENYYTLGKITIE